MPSGSAADLAALYHEHRAAVFAAACWMTLDVAAAEDVTHDVFVALAARAGPLPTHPRAFLLRAVRNRVASQRRHRRGNAVLPDDLAGHGPLPFDLAAGGERDVAVARALAGLPDEQREVVTLHVHGGLGFREIGDVCGTGTDTAASRWRYACTKLRRALAAQGIEQ